MALHGVDRMSSGSLGGALDELAGSYRFSADQDMDWSLGFDEPEYDAVVRLDIRPPTSETPPLPVFEERGPQADTESLGKDRWLESFMRAFAPPGTNASKGGAASMAALVAAAVCQLGMQNPVEAELAMQAEQEAELRAQAAQANAIQDAKVKEAAVRRAARRDTAAAAARAAGASVPNFPRPRHVAGVAAAAVAADVRSGATAAAGVGASQPAGFSLVPAAPAGTAQQAALRAAQLAAGAASAKQGQQPAAAPASAAPPQAAAAAPQAGKGEKGGDGGGKRKAPAAAAATSGGGKAAVREGSAVAAGGSGGASALADGDAGGGSAVRPAKRQRQATEDRRMWSLSVAFIDAKTGQAVRHKLDGSRFKSAKIPATVKFAFNREYIVRITADSSLILGGNARLVTRSPEFFEDVTDQAAATPYLEDDTVKLARVPPPLAAAALVAGGAAAAGAAAAPKAAAAVTRAAAAAPAAAAVTSTPAATAAAPLKEYEQSGRVTWEGKWRCLSEPVAATQRAALRLSLRLEGLGSVELPFMAKIYEAGIVHLGDSGAAAAAHGQPLHHVAFAVERNPWSELLEVAGASYVPAAPPAAH